MCVTKVVNAGGDGFVSFEKRVKAWRELSDGRSGVDGGFGSATPKPKCAKGFRNLKYNQRRVQPHQVANTEENGKRWKRCGI